MKSKIVISTLAALLVLSCLLNIFMFRASIESYRQQKRYQIDPLSYLPYHDENNKIKNKSKDIIRVVLFGDSRIFEWSPLPQLSGCEFINRGIPGETTAQSLLRIERDLISLKPDIAIIEIGVNDCNSIGALPRLDKFIITNGKDNIRKMASILNKNKIRTIFLTIFPVGLVYPHHLPVWSDDTKHAIAEINEFILQFDSPDMIIVNCDNIFLAGNRIKNEYANGMLHLNNHGYKKLNNYIKPYLVKTVEDLKLRDR
jgi:lysophospholipase L1-like esterase